MRVPKSNNLKNLLRNFYISSLSNKFPHIELNEIIDANNSDVSTRREFIAKLSKSAAFVGLVSAVPFIDSCKQTPNKQNGENQNSIENQPRIVIVGAGIAGMNCAYQLYKQGINATIYEGSFRVGGRILTHYGDALRNQVFAEFGGDFIDSNHKDMLDLAKEFNLELLDLVEEQKQKGLIKDAYFFNNKHYTEQDVINEFKKCASIIEKDAASLGEDYDTPEAIKFDSTPLSSYINSLPIANWIKELLSASYVAEFGLECNEQSTLNFLDMINPDTTEGFMVFGDSDERYRIKEGNSKIIQNIKDKLSTDAIVLNQKLTKIEDSSKGYKLTFNDKEIVEADIVVVTIPFTTLRNVEMNLKELSEDKRKCINEIGYGNNTKLVLAYNSQAWQEDGNNYMGYLFHKTISNGWDSSLIRHNQNAAYVCFFGGDVSKKLDDKATTAPFQPAHHSWKTQLPESEVSKFVDELDKIYPKSKNKFSDKHVFVDWISYPWSMASYSAYKVGQWNSISGKEQESIGSIYFAGEHCSENFQGFMNGGAETGRVAAEQIIKFIKKVK